MKKSNLEKEEKKILEEFDAGKLKSIKGTKKDLERYKQYAAYTLSKPRNINIRLSNKDLQKIKTLAVERGLPYQTLISSILHQYSSYGTDLELVSLTKKFIERYRKDLDTLASK